MNRYPRESTENVKFDPVSYDGTTYSNFEYSLTQGLDRPGVWQNPITVGSDKAFQLTGDMEPGYWKVWVRVTVSASVKPVIYAGRFLLT